MTFVKRLTGRGITSGVHMDLADLGIVRYDPKRKAYAYVFGDNFSFAWGQDWQSPSILMYDKDHNLLGIPAGTTEIISSGNRRQAIPYEHNTNGVSTMLPCDLIRVAGVWYMAVMVVGMRGLGDEKQTVFWQSTNLVDWKEVEPNVRLGHPGHPGNVMLTFDRIGDWVHVFGTGGLARDRGIWLWRNKADEFPHGEWEPWGFDGRQWKWGAANERTPILGGRYGELCFRHLQGNCVLGLFDVDRYCCSALCAPTPEYSWPLANRVDYAHGQQFPQLYGGYITDDSKLNEPNGMKFIVSQWNTQSNDPYHVIVFADTLAAAAPLTEPEPEPEPEPELPPIPETGDQMSPQALYELLLRELSASGSVKITTPEGDSVTLREAVEQIFYKARGLHDLTGRPRHPGEADDQLGHVLNARAEGLFTQAMLAALAEKAGINVKQIYQRVQRSIS